MEATEILAAAVQLTVGAQAIPRPGQNQMCADIASTLATRGQLVGIGPTGVGKSFALLSAAAWRAVEHGERTVFSTDSLSLQAQILRKDAPAISAAVESLGGQPIIATVVKGATNYADPRQLVLAAEALTGQIAATDLDDFAGLADLVEHGPLDTTAATAFADGASVASLGPLVAWGLRQYADTDLPGDKDSYAGEFTAAEWRLVSSGPGERAPDTHVPTPKVTLAHRQAAEADVVIVNHSLLALRAATGLPIVLGGKKLGRFDHLIVDEAQSLPDGVRERGAKELSGSDVISLTRTVQTLPAPELPAGPLAIWRVESATWLAAGTALADRFDAALALELGVETTKDLGTGGGTAGDQLDGTAGGTSGDLLDGTLSDQPTDPFAPLLAQLIGWAESVTHLTEAGSVAVPVSRSAVRIQRARAAAASLIERAKFLGAPVDGDARWLERAKTDDGQRSWVALKASPVDISSWIAERLWAVNGERLSAVTVSATLPAGFAREVGLEDNVRYYESPFASAYAGSAVFVPTATSQAALDALAPLTKGKRKRKFNTALHPLWAAQHVVALVRANSGSAIVLSATRDGGQLYAAALRTALPDLVVYSQWDGPTPARLIEAWRDNVGSVLVGTKLFMTGVDAPGETCSLVLLDRPPRRPMEPVYNARVAQLQATMSRWEADRLVYVADAVMLEEQSIGRLIRATTDSGMVAILDPRLRVGGPLSHHPDAQAAYYEPLKKFGMHFSDQGEAITWLQQRRAAARAV